MVACEVEARRARATREEVRDRAVLVVAQVTAPAALLVALALTGVWAGSTSRVLALPRAPLGDEAARALWLAGPPAVVLHVLAHERLERLDLARPAWLLVEPATAGAGTLAVALLAGALVARLRWASRDVALGSAAR